MRIVEALECRLMLAQLAVSQITVFKIGKRCFFMYVLSTRTIRGLSLTMTNDAMSQVFCLSTYYEMKPIHANWMPTNSVRVGDYGLRSGAMFQRLGNIEEFGLSKPSVRRTGGNNHYTFSSGSGTNVALAPSVNAKGVATVEAKVSFESEFSVFVNAAGCSQESVGAKLELGKQLERMPGFDKDWVVVTDIISSKNLILAVSSERGGEFTFSVETERFDWADASASFSLGSKKSVGYLDLGEDNRTPFIGLCGFTGSGIFRKPKFTLFGNEAIEEPTEPNELGFGHL